MKIRGIQIVGEKLEITKAIGGQTVGAVYISVKGVVMTIDTDDGSWIITEDEIIAFIEKKRKSDG